MRTAVFLVVVGLVATGCGGGADTADPAPESTSVSEAAPAPPPAPDDALRPGGEASGPEYDVYLASVDRTLAGTRFAGIAFEDPELTAATGLLLCERMEAGSTPDEAALEYLAELTAGDTAGADEAQIVLAGALAGAATATLCPSA